MEPKMKAVVVLVVVVFCANGVNPQSPYACWGGCYNKCYLGAVMAQSERLACGYLCLDTCIPRITTAADYKYYCHLGCYLKRCIPVSFDDARLDGCFGWCTNLCNEL